MTRKLKVDKAACISCQLCIDVLPAVFRADGKGLAEVHDSGGATEEEIEKIIESCPAQCIRWDKS